MDQTVHLIEDFDPALESESGAFVSLTPQASYEMTRRGIPYKILEDFYSETELRKGEKEFFREQLDWFADFDSFLRKNIRYCADKNVSLAKDSYLLIKYFVDSVIIQAFITRSFLERAGASDIRYWRRGGAEARSLSGFMYAQKGAMFHRLIPMAVKAGSRGNFSLRESPAAPAEARAAEAKPSAFRQSLKNLFNSWKYEGLGKSASGKRVHFLHSDSGHLDPVIRDFVRAGASVTICSSNEGPSGVRLEEDGAIKNDCRTAAVKLETEGGALLSWLDVKCGFPIAAFVRPYLQDFIQNDCFRILQGAREYEAYFQSQRTELVVTHTNTDFASKSALIAARARGIKTVCIQHGSDVFIDRAWQVTDIDAFDSYLSMDSISQRKFEDCEGKEPIGPCRVLQSPHYFKNIRSKAGDLSGVKDSRTVLYIPSKLLVHQRYFNCMVYPACWYFEYQKKLIDLFGSLPQYRFVYKHAASRVRYADESALPYLNDKKYPNVRVVSGAVSEHLKGAGAVILDRPTTAFYESLAAGRPTLALYPDFIEGMIDGEALKMFGKPLQSFSNFEEASAKIAVFLKELEKNAAFYAPELPLSDDCAVESLLREGAVAPVLQGSR